MVSVDPRASVALMAALALLERRDLLALLAAMESTALLVTRASAV